MSIKIDFTKNLGPIKPMHGVGQPPFYGARSFPMFHYLTEAGIPFSRLHDVAGPYGGGRFVAYVECAAVTDEKALADL